MAERWPVFLFGATLGVVDGFSFGILDIDVRKETVRVSVSNQVGSQTEGELLIHGNRDSLKNTSRVWCCTLRICKKFLRISILGLWVRNAKTDVDSVKTHAKISDNLQSGTELQWPKAIV